MKNYVTSYTRDVHVNRNKQLCRSSTLIDVVLHNSKSIDTCKTVMLPFTDHALLLTTCKFNTPVNEQPTYLSRAINEQTVSVIVDTLNSLDLTILNDIQDLNKRWFNFKQITLRIINDEAPLKRKKPRKHDPVPWYDAQLLKKSKLVGQQYDLYLKTKDKADHDLFKILRNEYTKLQRQKNIDFYLSKTASSFSSSRLFWDFYASVITTKRSKSQDNDIPTEICAGTISYTSHIDIANKFSNHFASQSTNSLITTQSCSSFINRMFSKNPHLMPKQGTHFNFQMTTEAILKKTLLSISPSSSPGVSEIKTSILHRASDSIVLFLTKLFNDSVATGTFPDEFKSAIVLPLYKKKGETNDMKNYRSISILPAVCKLFEKILAEQLRLYFIINNLFDSNQHGFRSRHSCETALHEIISTCLENLNKKLINLLLFIDFKKAFDTVDPKLLLIKLLNYGLTNSAIGLPNPNNYFSNRVQKVKVGEVFSDFAKIEQGVPQGSVLGPLLFIIFINDLPAFFQSYVKLFADDTTNIIAADSLNAAATQLTRVIRKLIEWCTHNRLMVNWSKTFIMLISNKRVKHPSNFECDGMKIDVVTSFKLLGVLIDNKLTFTDFVAASTSLINKKLFAIKRIFYLSFNVKMQFFKTFILPYFDYCLSLVIYFHKSAIQKLTKAYYTCLLRLFRFDFTNFTLQQIQNSLSNYNLNSFHHKILIKLSFFSFNIKNSEYAPSSLHNNLKKRTSSLFHNFRATTKTLIVGEFSNNKNGDLTFQNFFARFYNNISHNRQLFHIQNYHAYKTHFFININSILSQFVKIFVKFDFLTELNSFFY